MPKLITFKVPAKDKKGRIEILEKQGYIAVLHIGDKPEKFVLQVSAHDGKPEFLVHHATGQRMPGTLNEIKIGRMLAFGHNERTSDRDAAKELLAQIIDRASVDKVRAAIAAAPVCNP